MKVNPAEFVHPEDAEALRQMESITGFPTLVKKFMSLGLERLQYGLNLANSIRLLHNLRKALACRGEVLPELRGNGVLTTL